MHNGCRVGLGLALISELTDARCRVYALQPSANAKRKPNADRLTSVLVQNGLRVTVGLSAGSVVYNRVRQYAVFRRLQSGYCPQGWGNLINSAVYIPRPDEEDALQRILDPQNARASSMFFYVLGSAGAGNTESYQLSQVCSYSDCQTHLVMGAVQLLAQSIQLEARLA